MADQNLRYKVTADTKQFVNGMKQVQNASTRVNKNFRKQNQIYNNLAYALDDLQYGFRGIQNNLQQIAIQSGIGGPLIIGLTAATIAIGYLIEKTNFFASSIAGARKEFENLTKVQISSDEKIIKLSNTLLKANQREIDQQESLLKNGKELLYINKAGQAVYKELDNDRKVAIQTKLQELKVDRESLQEAKSLAQQRIDIQKQEEIARSRDTGDRISLAPAGTTLEEFRKWQKSALRLMKSFAHEWGIEWKNIGKITVSGGDEFINALKATQARLGHTVKPVLDEANQLGDALQTALSNAFVGIGQAIGEGLANGFDPSSFMNLLGQFMQQFGAALIAVGVAELALKLSGGNPGAAIAAGVALVAAGAAITAARSSNPAGSSGGGGRAVQINAVGANIPTSIQGQGSSNTRLGVRGQDLRYIQQVSGERYRGLS